MWVSARRHPRPPKPRCDSSAWIERGNDHGQRYLGLPRRHGPAALGCFRSAKPRPDLSMVYQRKQSRRKQRRLYLHAGSLRAIIAWVFMLATRPAPMRPAVWMPAQISIHVGVYNKPTPGGLTADPSVLDRGQSSSLHVNATGSECGGTLTYSWAASRRHGLRKRRQRAVQFERSVLSTKAISAGRNPSRSPLRLRLPIAKGGSANASTTVTVNLAAQVKHFGDIVFPKDSARVNNCGKRVLIEQLYPMLNSNANYDVVLVGHIDTNEVPKSKVQQAAASGSRPGSEHRRLY